MSSECPILVAGRLVAFASQQPCCGVLVFFSFMGECEWEGSATFLDPDRSYRKLL